MTSCSSSDISSSLERGSVLLFLFLVLGCCWILVFLSIENSIFVLIENSTNFQK